MKSYRNKPDHETWLIEIVGHSNTIHLYSQVAIEKEKKMFKKKQS